MTQYSKIVEGGTGVRGISSNLAWKSRQCCDVARVRRVLLTVNEGLENIPSLDVNVVDHMFPFNTAAYSTQIGDVKQSCFDASHDGMTSPETSI